MTSFEKQIIGLAELLVAIDCGALHMGNWRLPCPACVEKEREVGSTLQKAISDEQVRRHIRRAHDKRDGNKPIPRPRP